jgi:hypothetical protein
MRYVNAEYPGTCLVSCGALPEYMESPVDNNSSYLTWKLTRSSDEVPWPLLKLTCPEREEPLLLQVWPLPAHEGLTATIRLDFHSLDIAPSQGERVLITVTCCSSATNEGGRGVQASRNAVETHDLRERLERTVFQGGQCPSSGAEKLLGSFLEMLSPKDLLAITTYGVVQWGEKTLLRRVLSSRAGLAHRLRQHIQSTLDQPLTLYHANRLLVYWPALLRLDIACPNFLQTWLLQEMMCAREAQVKQITAGQNDPEAYERLLVLVRLLIRMRRRALTTQLQSLEALGGQTLMHYCYHHSGTQTHACAPTLRCLAGLGLWSLQLTKTKVLQVVQALVKTIPHHPNVEAPEFVLDTIIRQFLDRYHPDLARKALWSQQYVVHGLAAVVRLLPTPLPVDGETLRRLTLIATLHFEYAALPSAVLLVSVLPGQRTLPDAVELQRQSLDRLGKLAAADVVMLQLLRLLMIHIPATTWQNTSARWLAVLRLKDPPPTLNTVFHAFIQQLYVRRAQALTATDRSRINTALRETLPGWLQTGAKESLQKLGRA